MISAVQEAPAFVQVQTPITSAASVLSAQPPQTTSLHFYTGKMSALFLLMEQPCPRRT